jgi:hypothetical protein
LFAAINRQPIEFAGDPSAGDRSVGDKRQALAHAIIDRDQDAHATAIHELVGNEVDWPTFVCNHPIAPPCEEYENEKSRDYSGSSHMTNERIEVITSVQRRRHWSRAEKEKLVAASLEPGASVSALAQDASIHPSQLYSWRHQPLVGDGWDSHLCGSRQKLRQPICLAPE